jgi:hypothetical protein
MASQKTKFVTSLQGYILWHRIRQNLLPAYKATFYGIAEDKICNQLTKLHSMVFQKTKFVTSLQGYTVWQYRRQIYFALCFMCVCV